MITYRPADPRNDIEFARRTHRAAYHEVVVRQFGSWDSELQEKFFREGWVRAPHQIILLDGAPIGVFSVDEHEDHIFIHEIQILPEFQRRGIGARIVTEQISRARLKGKNVKLKVLRENDAKRLYERLGFVCCERSDIDYRMVWRGVDDERS